MNRLWCFSLLLVVLSGCYQRQDPVVQAAQDLQQMTYDMVSQDETQTRRLNSLRLGMSDREVLDTAGPPSSRQSAMISAEESREVWTYRGAMRPLATLVFVNQRLMEIKVE
jgi:hypothetical protein